MPQPSAEPAAAPLTPVQRTAAYALMVDRADRADRADQVHRADRVLLVRASPRSDLSGQWFLPGGGLQHGESPVDAVRRELIEETGLRVPAESVRPIDAFGDVIDLPHRGASLHTVRLIFEVDAPPEQELARLRPEPDGTSDQVRFVPLAEAEGLRLMPFVAAQLGLPERPVTVSRPERPEPLLDDAPEPVEAGADGAAASVIRVQRPAAYAVLVSGNPNGDGRLLLSKLSGSDLWTLPGGGIDHGEAPLVALTREVYEEAGLPYTAGPLLDISSRHFTGRAPGGRLEDFHGIRLLYAGSVPDRPAPRVVDVGGSSDDAAWFGLRELSRVRTVATVRHGLALLRRAAADGSLRR